MAVSVDRYIAKCQEIVEAKPAYVKNKSNLQECDCIGMDKYAFRENGVDFSSTGVNYTLRKQVYDIRQIVGTSDLQIGEVVFKVRKPGAKGYDLHEKYKPGGAEYNGDLNDYYHIGTVVSVYPLRIAHMTSPTAKVDTSIGKWAYAAKWLPQYIRQESGPEPAPDPDPAPEPVPDPEPAKAVVWSENGMPVNLRARPSRAAALVDRVPYGETVQVESVSCEWARVKWKWKEGYMMTEYLIMPENPYNPFFTVTIRHVTKGQAEALADNYPEAEITEERG